MAGCFCVFVYVTVYNYVNVCTSHNNKPFTYLLLSNMKLNNLHNIGADWLWHTLNSWGIRESTDPLLPFLSEDIAMLTSSILIWRSKNWTHYHLLEFQQNH